MSFNLVEMVKNHINNDLINLISRAVNGSDIQTQAAINSAVPGLFDNFSDTISNELGADSLFQAVDSQDDSMLDCLSDQLIENNHKSFANSGAYSLNSLLGVSKIESLINGMSKDSGLSHSSSSILMRILTPIILSVIKRKLYKDNRLNVIDLVGLLKEQQTANFFEKGEVNGEESSVQINKTVMTDTKKVGITGKKRRNGKDERKVITRKKWLPLLYLLLFAALFFAYSLFFNPNQKSVELSKGDSTVKVENVTTVKNVLTTAERSSLEELKTILASVTTTLKNITDANTAKARLGELEQAVVNLEDLSQNMQTMSTEAKLEAASLVNSKVPQMEVFYERVKNNPEGKIIIEPVINRLMKKLADTFI